MQFGPIMHGGNVGCKSGLHFDENDKSNVSFNKKISISHDNIFGANFESQEVSINKSFLTPLKNCVDSISFKGIIT